MQIPELMLQNNGHFIGVGSFQGFRHLHPLCSGLEGDVKMALAWQAFMLYQRERASDNGSERIFDQQLVIYCCLLFCIIHPNAPYFVFASISPHLPVFVYLANLFCRTACKTWHSGNLVGPLLLPGAIPNPACPSSIEQGFKDGFCYRVTQQQQPEQCCRLQLLHGPITAGTIPNEDKAFTTCVDPVSPPKHLSAQ